MTASQLPNLALFTFKVAIAPYPKTQVWQKQYIPGDGRNNDSVYAAQAISNGGNWKRGPAGIGNVEEDEVEFVEQLQQELE
jgi:hypothetical protein